jgi:hypothetical protein
VRELCVGAQGGNEMVIWIASAWLACFAVLLEMMDRAPEIPET